MVVQVGHDVGLQWSTSVRLALLEKRGGLGKDGPMPADKEDEWKAKYAQSVNLTHHLTDFVDKVSVYCSHKNTPSSPLPHL